MIEAFRELELHFLSVSETWFSSSRSLVLDLKDLNDSERIGAITKNRSARGGGVAIFFDTTKITLKPAYFFPAEHEALCAVGKSVLDVRKFVIFSVYLPPRTDAEKLRNFNNLLEERLERAKSEINDPYIIITGDLNRKSIEYAIRNHPDVHLVPTGSTRYFRHGLHEPEPGMPHPGQVRPTKRLCGQQERSFDRFHFLQAPPERSLHQNFTCVARLL